jgi:hypothetical protein
MIELEEHAVSFYQNDYALMNFNTETDTYKSMMIALREIFDGNLRDGFRFENKKYPYCYDLKDNPFEYDDSFIDILFENNVDIFLRDIVGTTACLSHIQVINAYPYPDKTSSYQMWHRDAYHYVGENFVGNCPPTTKVIFYPTFDEEPEPVLSFVPGSSHTVLQDRSSDLSQGNSDRISVLKNSNEQFLIFNTTMLHSTMPVREKNLRIIYNFNPEIHLHKYENTKRCQDIWKERSV